MEPLNPTRRLLNKRKRTSLSPSSSSSLSDLTGIFTRSKSRIYVHTNRSGRARRDSHTKPIHKFYTPDSYSQILEPFPVKDLMTRRVFSDGPVHSNGKYFSDFEDKLDVFEEHSKIVENDDLALISGPQQLQRSNSNNTMVANVRPGKFFVAPGSFRYRRLVPFLEDNKPDQISAMLDYRKDPSSETNEYLETHNPNSNRKAFNDSSVTEYSADIDCNGSTEISNDEKSRDGAPHKLDVHSITGLSNNYAGQEIPLKNENNGDVEQRKGPHSSNKMVSDMRKRKVFKVPGSFSYRRLLPYLEDTERDQTAASKTEIANEQSISGQEVQLIVNNHAAAALDDLMEECPQSLSEQDLSHVNKVSDTAFEDNILNHGSLKSDSDGLTKVNDLQEDNVQTTPPDSVIFTAPKMNGCLPNIEGKSCVSKSILPCHNPDDISTNAVCNENMSSLSPNESNVTLSKLSTVLNPCSRQRVFKPSGSFSYRRLLPYLTSVSTTQTSDSKIPDPETPKTEQAGEKRPRLFDSSKEGISMDHLNPESSPKMHGTGENKHNHAVDTPTQKNHSDQVLSSATPPSINALDMQNEEPLQTVYADSNFLPKLNSEISRDKVDGLHAEVICSNTNENTLLADSNMEVSPIKLDETGQDSVHVDNGVVGGTIVTEERPKELLNPESHVNGSERGILKRNPRRCNKETSANKRDETDQDSVHEDNEPAGVTIVTKERPSQDSLNARSHLNGSDRGILKRNPRGCRGLCDCLHCSSFRLNAEKAFWFSRNQLQNAEEVADDLVKELSSLRHMLDSSTAEASDPAVIHLNKLQVEEACRKALEAEERAKERLSEMNDDLNNHCRTKSLSRPRVTFHSKNSN